MLGPYTAVNGGKINYRGNNIFQPMGDIGNTKPSVEDLKNRVIQFSSDLMWGHIARINHRINFIANSYFDNLGALFTTLPLTTRMISSPGAVYGKEAINYTTDTCPITLNWFDLPNKAFLSESSQIYLEISLTQKNVDHVYSIYNSFRKEKADSTHLSEFHHIEYEGHVSQQKNVKVALGLIKVILKELLNKELPSLSYFLSLERISELRTLSEKIHLTPKITFKKALDLLYQHTKNEKYKKFTLKHFGSWEEIKLTEIFGGMIIIEEYPLLEVPFYHAMIDNKFPSVANNSDVIWPGYRETIGSGHRVRSREELEKKSKIFNLPLDDYKPYLQTRNLKAYKTSSGFGLGWERLLQGLLEMPFIWSASQFPRVDSTLKP